MLIPNIKCSQDAFVDTFSTAPQIQMMPHIHNVAYKPFGERSEIYPSPTAQHSVFCFTALS